MHSGDVAQCNITRCRVKCPITNSHDKKIHTCLLQSYLGGGKVKILNWGKRAIAAVM